MPVFSLDHLRDDTVWICGCGHESSQHIDFGHCDVTDCSCQTYNLAASYSEGRDDYRLVVTEDTTASLGVSR